MSERAAHAVILSTGGGTRDHIDELESMLERLELTVERTDSVANATAAVDTYHGAPVCVIVDSRDQFAAIVAALRDAVATLAPIVVFAEPTVELVIAAFHAGAGDVIDLSTVTDSAFERSVQRVSDKTRVQRERRAQMLELRNAFDEFLRAVVQTERRSIDLENQLAAQRAGSLRDGIDDAERRPVVLIVEPDRPLSNLLVDRLEDMGVITVAFVNGDDAVRHSRQLAANSEPIDLALLDASEPDSQHIELLERLREDRPYLAAILLGDRPGTDAAIEAAELGVVGYVPKPLQDVAHVLDRVREQAIDNQQSGRERHYLARIKGRHERVLTRYQQLQASLDEWEF